MNSKDIQEAYGRLKEKNKRTAMNEAYVEGRNPYIMSKPTEKKPDNRIPVPLAKMAVEDMAGYAGRAGDIVTDYELTSKDVEKEDDPFISYIRAMDAYNKEQLETSELYEEVLVQGESFELWWASDKVSLPKNILTAEYKIVDNSAVYLKYTNAVKQELEYGIYFYEDEDKHMADVNYPFYKEIWASKDSSSWELQDTIDHPFSSVPINVFTGNRRKASLFQAEKPLIDAFDELISKTLNEVDRYNALIALFGGQVDEEFVKAFEQAKVAIIDGLGDDDGSSNLPRYLEKNLSGVNEFYNQLTDRIEDLFHKSVKIPDMTDESFAGAQSGIAIAFKLVGMEFKAAQIETYFNQGLMKRLDFYADIYNVSTMKINREDYKSTVKAQRNLPIDVKAKAEVVQILSGILSEETALKILPKTIVDDVAKEIERKKEEAPTDILGLKTEIEQAE